MPGTRIELVQRRTLRDFKAKKEKNGMSTDFKLPVSFTLKKPLIILPQRRLQNRALAESIFDTP